MSCPPHPPLHQLPAYVSHSPFNVAISLNVWSLVVSILDFRLCYCRGAPFAVVAIDIVHLCPLVYISLTLVLCPRNESLMGELIPHSALIILACGAVSNVHDMSLKMETVRELIGQCLPLFWKHTRETDRG